MAKLRDQAVALIFALEFRDLDLVLGDPVVHRRSIRLAGAVNGAHDQNGSDESKADHMEVPRLVSTRGSSEIRGAVQTACPFRPSRFTAYSLAERTRIT